MVAGPGLRAHDCENLEASKEPSTRDQPLQGSAFRPAAGRQQALIAPPLHTGYGTHLRGGEEMGDRHPIVVGAVRGGLARSLGPLVLGRGNRLALAQRFELALSRGSPGELPQAVRLRRRHRRRGEADLVVEGRNQVIDVARPLGTREGRRSLVVMVRRLRFAQSREDGHGGRGADAALVREESSLLLEVGRRQVAQVVLVDDVLLLGDDALLDRDDLLLLLEHFLLLGKELLAGRRDAGQLRSVGEPGYGRFRFDRRR